MQAATMMENMSEEQLRSMAAMMPGGAAVSGASGWGMSGAVWVVGRPDPWGYASACSAAGLMLPLPFDA